MPVRGVHGRLRSLVFCPLPGVNATRSRRTCRSLCRFGATCSRALCCGYRLDSMGIFRRPLIRTLSTPCRNGRSLGPRRRATRRSFNWVPRMLDNVARVMPETMGRLRQHGRGRDQEPGKGCKSSHSGRSAHIKLWRRGAPEELLTYLDRRLTISDHAGSVYRSVNAHPAFCTAWLSLIKFSIEEKTGPGDGFRDYSGAWPESVTSIHVSLGWPGPTSN